MLSFWGYQDGIFIFLELVVLIFPNLVNYRYGLCSYVKDEFLKPEVNVALMLNLMPLDLISYESIHVPNQ